MAWPSPVRGVLQRFKVVQTGDVITHQIHKLLSSDQAYLARSKKPRAKGETGETPIDLPSHDEVTPLEALRGANRPLLQEITDCYHCERLVGSFGALGYRCVSDETSR